jgi:hypothetical protein
VIFLFVVLQTHIYLITGVYLYLKICPPPAEQGVYFCLRHKQKPDTTAFPSDGYVWKYIVANTHLCFVHTPLRKYKEVPCFRYLTFLVKFYRIFITLSIVYMLRIGAFLLQTDTFAPCKGCYSEKNTDLHFQTPGFRPFRKNPPDFKHICPKSGGSILRSSIL